MDTPTLDSIPTTRKVWDRKQAAMVPEAEMVEDKPSAFLSGVVPLDWLACAHGQGGQCLAVGVLLWHMRNKTKRPVVWVSRPVRARFGVSDRGYWEALRRLEVAGLVVVERRAGRALRVEIRTGGLVPET